MSTRLDDYERHCADEIRVWLDTAPDWGTRLMDQPGHLAAAAAQALVPTDVLRGTLRALDRTAGRLAGSRDVLRWAGASNLDDLAMQSLRDADRLARRVEHRAMALAGSGGAVLGVGGAFTMAVDIPTLLTLALRTIHRSAYCYGEDWQAEGQQGLAIGVFALASASTLDEKHAAWSALHGKRALLDAAWRDGVERVAERELAKDAAHYSLQTLSRRIGRHIGGRKGFGLMPLVGALIGGSVNAGYIRDVAAVARHVLRDRWLHRHHPRMRAIRPSTSRGERPKRAVTQSSPG